MASALPSTSDCCGHCHSSNTTPSLNPVLASLLTVDTLAALAAYVLYVNDLTVSVLGGAVKGDGGGGVYYFDISSLADDNGLSVIRPSSISPTAPGRWLKFI
jgi:hypothetical protein